MAEPYADQPRTAPSLPPQPHRARRWMLIFVLVWTLLLVAGIGWATLRGRPTAPEQTTIEQAAPTVARASADLVRAASGDLLAVAAVSGYERVDECSVTVFRDGARYQRTVTVLVAPGTEGSLLGRVADRLPASYAARVRLGGAPRLVADAGFFVSLSGAAVAPGVVRFVLDTGCRPEGEPAGPPVPPAAAPELAPMRQAVLAVLRRLQTPSVLRMERVSCGDGTSLTTVEGQGTAAPDLAVEAEALTGALDTVPGGPGPGAVVVATPDAFGYRTATFGLAVRTDADRLVVSATSSCA